MLLCLADSLFWVDKALRRTTEAWWRSFIETSRDKDGAWQFAGDNCDLNGTMTTHGVLSKYLDLPLTKTSDGNVGLPDCLQGEILVMVSSLAPTISGSDTSYLLGVCMVYNSHGYHAWTICAHIIFGGCTCWTRITVGFFLFFIRLGIVLVFYGFAICRCDHLCACVLMVVVCILCMQRLGVYSSCFVSP